MTIDQLIDDVIAREGGYSDHPADRGGPTRWGVTERIARAHGYAGDMRVFPRSEAAAIYRRLYWLRPRFDQVAERAPALAAELFDTGVNMGPAVAARFPRLHLLVNNAAQAEAPRPASSHLRALSPNLLSRVRR